MTAARERIGYGRIGLDGQFWVLEDVPPHVAIKLKGVFPKIDKTQTKKFTFRNTKESCTDLEWFLSRYPMTMSDEVRGIIEAGRRQFDDDRNSIEGILLPSWQPTEKVGFRPSFEPRLEQLQAAEITHRLKRLLVVDDMGLGKTWTAMATMVGSSNLPAAVVVLPHLTEQWAKRFIEKFTYLKVHVIEGTAPYNLPPANVYLFKYSNIVGWVDVAATGCFKTVIFDEIQELRRGDDAKKGKAGKVFAHNANVVQGLSATPIYNYGSEIYRIMEVLSPGCLGSWDEFCREWCVPHNNKWIVEDPDALGTYLREMQLMVRRETDRKPTNKIYVQVEYDDEVAKATMDLAKMLALRVVEGNFAESGQAARELDMLARRVTGLAKARHVAAYVRMLLKTGNPVLLVGWHRDVYEVWMEELQSFAPRFYTGTENSRKKSEAEKAFLKGDTDLLIMSLRSGAGIDGLQKRCAHVVHGELDWTSKIHDQVNGRLDRDGQVADEVTAHYCVANSGSDPVVLGVHGVKANQSRGILNPLQGMKPVYTDESRMKLLAQKYLEMDLS